MKNKLKSINFKILIPIAICIIFQALVIISVFEISTRRNLNNLLVDSFKSSVSTRRTYLESSMSNRWAYLDNAYQMIDNEIELYIDETDHSIDEILNNKDLSIELLERQSEIVSKILITNNVNNAFFILDNQDDDAIFLSTKSPEKVNESEIYVDFAPDKIVKYYQKKGFEISDSAYEFNVRKLPSTQFFDKPVNFAYDNKVSYKVCGYWGTDLDLGSGNILTYTIPVSYNNKVIGALGIGLSVPYLQKFITNLTRGVNLNIGLVKSVKGNYVKVFNAYVDYSLPDITDADIKREKYPDLYSFNNNGFSEFAYFEKISLNTAYNEAFYLFGIKPENEIFKPSNTASNELIIIILTTMLATLIVVYIITTFISKPIVDASKEINENNIRNIPKTKITEVDLLLNNLQIYFNKSLELNEKLNRVINDSNVNIALAEYIKDDEIITATSKFFSMLHIDYKEDVVSKDEFVNLISNVDGKILSSNTSGAVNDAILNEACEFVVNIDESYYRLKSEITETGVMITLIDLTSEYTERLRIEHERDYDVLTGLLNRRGFYLYAEKCLKENKNCAIYMIDIDNLKKINDEYGHEIGDYYIKVAGDYFMDLQKEYKNLTAGHLSGDEFILFLNNPKTNDDVLEVANRITSISDYPIDIFETKTHITLSCGVALYEEGLNFAELKKRADFAMYSVKRSGKNSLAFFDTNSYELYQKENLMVGELNKLINNELIRYAYQPIVDINTGEVLGYEALMRPNLESFKSPLEVIDYAKKYNKLYDIERLTFFLATDKFFKEKCGKKLFINSIASQALTDSDMDEYIAKYSSIFKDIVTEIIEEDFGQTEIIKGKTSTIKRLGMNYAIDDYGTGFNNIGMILDFTPNYIKIEGSLIRGIDHDEKKKQFTKSIIDFCKGNNIKLIAESVETKEELKCVKELGCDYVQGYLIAKPNFEIVDISEDKKELLQNT